MSVPIAFIVFNRPQHTQASYAAIRVQRPEKLFIIADGPRPGHPTDAELCAEVRAILEHIDWPCEVLRNYSEGNLGCRSRPESGIDWVFSQVDRAIILEDDCVPHPDFFRFCDELLTRYKDDERVMAITGDNFQDGQVRGNASYYFSKYNHVWGWATWRRAWQKNDHALSFWPNWKASSVWRQFIPDTVERAYWEAIFDRMYRNEIDTWDYPWTASVWFNGGLTATPNVNLVSNIGFGPGATHTTADDDRPGRPVIGLGRIEHPASVVRNAAADRYTFDHQFGGRRLRMDRSPAQHVLRLAKRAASMMRDRVTSPWRRS